MIKRERYLSRIRPFLGGEPVKVLTGIRRSGKSTLLQLIQQELLASGVLPRQILSLRLDPIHSPDSADELRKKLVRRVSAIPGKAYLFFDDVPDTGWEACVDALRAECGCDCYVTGTNTALAASLVSPRVEFTVHPLSYREFLEAYRAVFPTSSEREAFARYLRLGGMPFLNHLRFEEEPSRQYLQDLYGSALLRDVVGRNNLRSVELLERIIGCILSNVGGSISAIAVSKLLKNEGRFMAAPETIANHIRACEEAFLIHRVGGHDFQGRPVPSANEAYYAADHGMWDAVFGTDRKEIVPALKNIVYLELLRRGYRVKAGEAIDFIGERNGEKLYVHVCHLLASEEAVRREFGVFDGVQDHFPKYVLSLDEFDRRLGGARHRNLRDFLLEDDWG